MKKRYQTLQAALRSGQLIWVGQASDPDTHWRAFVVGLSDTFVLLNTVNKGFMALQGYTALPLEEVKAVGTFAPHQFVSRALALKNIVPEPQPDILLADFPGLLSSVNSHFPVVALFTERLDSRTYSIGRVSQMKKRSVLMREISTGGQWMPGTSKYRFRDVTRVDFGGGYEAALWMVAESDREARTP